MDVELEALGRKISDLRKAQGWRLADIAEATGYTTSYLSQIETGVSIPSLTALATVALALGVEMTALLADFAEPSVTITRAGEGSELKLSNGMTYLTMSRLGSERPYTVMTQNLSSEKIAFRHFGERFMLVLSGEIQISFSDQDYLLDELATIHYGAHEEHTTQSNDGSDGRILIVSSPALF